MIERLARVNAIGKIVLQSYFRPGAPRVDPNTPKFD
jgi:hypothetical protein